MYIPYKITYFSFDKTFDINSKKEYLENINDILDRKSKNEETTLENLKNDLELNYDLLYKIESGLQKHLFIFVGEFDKTIKDILDLIEENKIYPDSEDLQTLNTFFSYDCQKEWGNFENYTKIKFLNSYIKNDDTISSIRTTICTKLTSNLSNKDILFPEQIYFTCELEKDSYMCLDNKDCHTNLSFSSEQIVIQNIQKKILEKRGKLNYQNIKYELIGLRV